MNFKRSETGFTLVELLVVIAILGIISVIGFTTYKYAQEVSRDSKRKSDLKSIATALDLYYENNNYTYPIPYPGSGQVWHRGWVNSTAGPNWLSNATPNVSLSPHYIDVIPVDPVNFDNGAYDDFATGSQSRIYAYKSDNPTDSSEDGCPEEGKWYALGTVLENPNDPESAINKNTAWCNGTPAKNLNFSGQPFSVLATAAHIGVYLIVGIGH